MCGPKIVAPFLIDCLQIQQKKNESACLITNKDLKSGDVLAFEKPFVGVLKHHSLYNRCANCMKESALKLIPCEICAYVMFCSENCKIAGFELHQHECGIEDIYKLASKNDNFYSLPRLILKHLYLFDGSVEKMKEFLEEKNPSPPGDSFTLDICNNEKSLIKAVYSRYKEIMYDYDNEILLECYFSLYPKIKETMANIELRSFMCRFLDLILYHTIGNESTSGFYLLQAVMQSSCAPNVHSVIREDGKMIYVVQHPIKAGEKITIT